MNPNSIDPNNPTPTDGPTAPQAGVAPDLSSVLQSQNPNPSNPPAENQIPSFDQLPPSLTPPPPPPIEPQVPQTELPAPAEPNWQSAEPNPTTDFGQQTDPVPSSSFNWSAPATSPVPDATPDMTTTQALPPSPPEQAINPTPQWGNPIQQNEPMATPEPTPEPLTPTFTPPDTQTPDLSSTTTLDTNQNMLSPTDTPLTQTETAPNDLSQLVAQAPEIPPVVPPTITQPETLVSGTDNNGSAGVDMPNIPMENGGGGIPKWVIGVAIGLIIVVAGASAYFILGIGKNTPEAGSLPATTQNQQTLREPPQPLSQPSPAAQTTTPTSGFDQVGSSGGGTTPGATSAADLLRARQGR